MKILYANKDEIISGAFAVYVTLGAGKFAYHEGPKDYAYFTEEQANKLIAKIEWAKEINPAHWDFGAPDPYKELRNLEDEYYARMAGE